MSELLPKELLPRKVSYRRSSPQKLTDRHPPLIAVRGGGSHQTYAIEPLLRPLKNGHNADRGHKE